jgi:hypothetical protein
LTASSSAALQTIAMRFGERFRAANKQWDFTALQE